MGRLSQRAGTDSVQVQTNGNVLIGVDEKRAREIAQDTARQVIQEYTIDAQTVIQDRIFKLDDRVIAGLVRAGRIEAFADPGFQRSYRKAQNGAASTERESDYDMLAALITDRADRGADRPIRAGIERAVEIVDQIDDEALRGLTVFQAMAQYRPLSPFVKDGLDSLESLFVQLVDGPLPSGDGWLDHLDILDAIRFNQLSELRKFQDFFPEKVIGYVAPGLPAGESPEMIGSEFPLVRWGAAIISHELKEGNVRIGTPNLDTFDSQIGQVSDARLSNRMVSEAKSRFGLGQRDEQAVQRLLEEVRERPTLKTVSEWWDSVPKDVPVTGVGRVLARANAERLDTRRVLPPLA